MTTQAKPPAGTKHSAPELLSPAGDWEALRAAVANGADAVYFGLSLFNARHRAANFTPEELPEVMAYLHQRNVKGFVTFNTLIFSDELEQAADYIRILKTGGADAVIVQDLGLCMLIQHMAPGLVIHGSTQMTLTEPRGIDFVRQLGVKRVVLARELSVQDIAKVAAKASTEVEVFVHGALCVAYSGQCLTSESLGGRSANRGQCAQACRLPYELIVDGQKHDMGDKAYLLSPQDLAAYDLIDDLTRIGVSCFKIEGRLKSAHYVAATTQTYRGAIDAAAAAKRFVMTPAEKGDLEQTFSRGLSHGFLDGTNHQKLVTARFPKSRGRRIGTIAEVRQNSVVVRLEDFIAGKGGANGRGYGGGNGGGNGGINGGVKPGDGVVFDEGHPEQDEQGGRVFAVRDLGKRGRHNIIEIELGRHDVNLRAVAVNAVVWKTDDPALRKRLEHTWSRDVIARRKPISARLTAHAGSRPELTLTYRDGGVSGGVNGGVSASAWDEAPLAVAEKHVITQEVAREQIGRLGDTPFELADLVLDISGRPMVPKSVLNDLRRRAAASLLEKMSGGSDAGGQAESIDLAALEKLRGWVKNIQPPAESDTNVCLHVLVRSMSQLEAALSYQGELKPSTLYCDFEDVRLYKDAVARCRSAGVGVGLGTVRVIKPGEEGFLRQVIENQPDVLLVRNLSAMAMVKEIAPGLPMIGDYSLNVANELTAGVLIEAGVKRLVPSYDLNWRQMQAMFGKINPAWFEVVVHQHMPMFHMEHCVFAHTLSTGKDYRDCGRPCEKHHVELRDHKGHAHPLLPDVGCRNTLFNGQAQSAAKYVPQMLALGIRHFRIEMLRENASELTEVLRRYEGVLLGKEDASLTSSGGTVRGLSLRGLTVINQLGVTAGTLERE